MADNVEEETKVPQQELLAEEPKPVAVAKQEESPPQPQDPNTPTSMAAEAETLTLDSQPPQGQPEKVSVSFSIWPPTQRTRDAVLSRLIETLSAPSVLSKRYGVVPAEEAAAVARRVEEEAFGVAAGFASTEDDGIEILQVYSKEISRRMLDAVKSRSAAGDGAAAPESAAEAAPSEDISSVETES
ncbi:hypothetical protein RJ639_013303 [Escallonia herrerae]|uniref:WPP domain-containing protein n=1 Tax=Escallonia herrerae TaxID=1293975 RepID=A0AA89AKU0_9ASTE|nr:hypothetical protein RJ639_013303 [Escallonia herrerae]